MIHYLFKISNFVPNACFRTVFDIDYNKLYENGRRIILIDLDNTLIPYDEFDAKPIHIELFKKIKTIGLQVIIISNNKQNRVKRFAEKVNCDYIYSALKPLKKGYKKALKKLKNYDHHEIISIGDQIMTDVLGSSRVGIPCILVKPIKKKIEKWYTRINRKMETKVLKRLKKHYPETYEKIKKIEEINE